MDDRTVAEDESSVILSLFKGLHLRQKLGALPNVSAACAYVVFALQDPVVLFSTRSRGVSAEAKISVLID